MTQEQRDKSIASFVNKWRQAAGKEKQETQRFWIGLLNDVCGATRAEDIIAFEKAVDLKHKSFIDGYIAETRTLIEQKGRNINLDLAEVQSDGTALTPYEQAKRYDDALPASQKARWIVVCNFDEIRVHDMEKPHPKTPQAVVHLCELEREAYRLSFLVDAHNDRIRREEDISIKAGELVGELYDALAAEYRDGEGKRYGGEDAFKKRGMAEQKKCLNVLCVRVVFCLYAEDAGLFNSRTAFEDYITQAGIKGARQAMLNVFRILNTPEKERGPYEAEEAAAFPFANGGLFSDDGEHILEVPNFTPAIMSTLLKCADFNWAEISPSIFGSAFESTLDPMQRHDGGMHYTSVDNIERATGPLFLDSLKAELEGIKRMKDGVKKRYSAQTYQDRLAALTFLDPACGSGNFLTATYTALRTLENEAIAIQLGKDAGEGRAFGGEFYGVKVSLKQFYGIEINDFAVAVSRTALWIAESQMLRITERLVGTNLHFLPLHDSAHITEGNALTLDWLTVCGGARPHYIMGNPPFVGARVMTKEQKAELAAVFGVKWRNAGNLDYVSAWYKKAADMMAGSNTRAALVSTNSITQGEAVAILWKPLMQGGRSGTAITPYRHCEGGVASRGNLLHKGEIASAAALPRNDAARIMPRNDEYRGGECRVHIDFAHRSFKWANESKKGMAHVFCVIVGFSTAENDKARVLYTHDEDTEEGERGKAMECKNISPYLIDAPNVFVERRSKPLCDVREMVFGSMPNDGGNLIIEDKDYAAFIQKEPRAAKWVRPFVGAEEFIKGKKRWCLWLVDCPPNELTAMKYVMERIKRCQQGRRESKRETTRQLADAPALFGEIRQPTDDGYVIIPRVSTSSRQYIPMGFLHCDTIASDAAIILPYAALYHFGILTSSVHMAWMRATCGRLGMGYRYSVSVVYNNFPWPAPSDAQRSKIEAAAQGVLDARALFPDATLADLYNDAAMPPALRKAHKELDKAVLAAYGWRASTSEEEIVSRLMAMYQKMAGAGSG